MRRSSHKEKVNRQEYVNEKNKRYFACLANEPTSDSAREAFRRPAYYGVNVRTPNNLTCDGCKYDGTEKIDEYRMVCCKCKRNSLFKSTRNEYKDMYVKKENE